MRRTAFADQLVCIEALRVDVVLLHHSNNPRVDGLGYIYSNNL